MVFCCGCQATVQARLTNGSEIYPSRPDLAALPFWKCDQCRNYVGCHHKTKTPTRPLGCIPTPAIKAQRQRIHKELDALWESGRMERSAVYAAISRAIQKEYHTADIRSVEEAGVVLGVIRGLREATI